MRTVNIGRATVSKLCIGGNPFSGFSHQDEKKSREMVEYYTPECIIQTLKTAEQAGIDAFFGRTDDHILGIVRDCWDQGGTIQWFAQISQDSADPESWRKWLKASIELGATGAYLHGGTVDFWYANKMFDHFREALDMMREADLAAGFAGHSPNAHEWIRDNLDVDFQMCCHYNPTDRSKSPHHISMGEKWNNEDRERMLKTIDTIQSPVVHYKVFAGGNKPIIPAFQLLGEVMKPKDIVLVGIFLKDNPNMIAEDVSFCEEYIEKI